VGGVRPRAEVKMTIHRSDGVVQNVSLRARIDTAIESDYYSHGGILPYVLRQLVA
jgi:aconitate hydratase